MTDSGKTTTKATRARFMCDVRRLGYNFDTGIGRLDMASGNCCDMSGCIAVFTAIDAAVWRIETFAGDQPDTIYVQSPRGSDWRAYEPPPPGTVYFAIRQGRSCYAIDVRPVERHIVRREFKAGEIIGEFITYSDAMAAATLTARRAS